MSGRPSITLNLHNLPSAPSCVQELFDYAFTSIKQPPAANADGASAAAAQLAAADNDSADDELAQSIHVEDGFDAEQVWLQLELLTGPLLRRSRKLLNRLKQQPPDALVPAEVEEGLDAVLADGDEEAEGSEGGEKEGEEAASSEDGEEEEGSEEEEGEEEGGEAKKLQKRPKKKAKLLPVEDR